MPKYLKTKEGSLESAVESVSTAKKDEGFASDAQRKAAFASGYKEPKNKKKKEEGNAFGAALQAAKEKGEKTFTVAGKKFDVKTEEEKLDKVNPTAVKKKFDDRKDKDIDNDGDVDSTDKYLHKRRKAISKAVKSEDKQLQEKPANYLELEFKDKREANRAYDMINNKLYATGNQPFDMDVPEGNFLQFEDLRDADKLMSDLKRAGFKFKVGERESVQEETTLAMKAAQYISSMWAEAAAEKDGVKTKSELHDMDKDEKKKNKTMTGKEMSKVEVTPKDKV
tara:strand:- start:172 stop:1014 length:843 start_codon:yes stop_codon:yes gene_type:complete